MKAVLVHRHGPPEEYTVGDIEVPHAGPGQIQVRIAAASLNAIDLRLATGGFRGIVDLPFPYVPGGDFSGTVTEVGGGVTAYAMGDLVFGHGIPRAMAGMLPFPKPSLTTGALAEFAVFEADTPFIARRPSTLDVETAAALPTAGLTTNALLRQARIQPDETVLVIGATGGVGTTLLPAIKAGRVIATARAGDIGFIREIGATETIDYGDYPPGGVDVVINLVLPTDHLADAAKCLKSGGRLYTITFPPPKPEYIDRDDVRFEMVLDLASGVDAITGLTPSITRRYALDDGARALRDFARDHTVGKLVVVP
ncbi:NADP-dependent oxidoreductase [Actinoplanes subtropicus]|uniref:NADP-dependent oxidoreductase n=1 Tax=Actinoplanes subtropicus TaxID=543632 RepID=UPI0004C30AC7|nr:NADP-dependent oxidoreductase [Actinoplanes subtropicus]